MRILVTGGAGFIGFHLARHLAGKDNEVVVCDNLFRGQADHEFEELIGRGNVQFVRADLTDPAEVRCLGDGFDVVYHLAAINGTRHFYEIPHQVLRANLLSLVNILDWVSGGGGKKLVWTSSSEVYAGSTATGQAPVPTPEDIPLTIDDISNPRFSYAASKIAGESLCFGYAKARGLPVVIVRPHNIYGPRMGYDHVIPEFLTRIIERQDPFKVFGGQPSRAFCFVDDFVRGLDLAGASAVEREIINLGNDHEVRIIDLVHRMFDLFGFHPQVESLPAPPGSTQRRCPDITKARQLLGYSPQVSIEVGLRITYDWYLAHKAEGQ